MKAGYNKISLSDESSKRRRSTLTDTGDDAVIRITGISANNARERRMENRIRMLRLVDIELKDGRRSAGIAYNIGPRGMFVLSRSGPLPHSDVDIAISVANESSLALTGVVVHRHEYGFGLRFRDLDRVAHAFVNTHYAA